MITIDLQKKSAEKAETKILLNEAIKHIYKSKKTSVLTGAGISCNAGIPDFRSASGLYNLVKQKYPNMKTVVKGQDLFDISLFREAESLSLFCTFMESLYDSTKSAKPTETHKFIKILKDRNKLIRCYTQNIDSLESILNLNVGINLSSFDENSKSSFNQTWKNLDVIQLHGNLHKLSCTQCFTNYNWTKDYQILLNNGTTPNCNSCYEKYQSRLFSGKRITSNLGFLRPDIVLYGENHPQSEILSKGLNSDLKLKSDLLIIMGTSLRVDGVKKLVKSLANSIHSRNGKVVFINKTPLSKQWSNFVDYEILCDCDQFIKILKIEIPDLFLTQEQLDSKRLKNNQPSTSTSKALQLDKLLRAMIKLENDDIETDVDEEEFNEIKKEEEKKTEVKSERKDVKSEIKKEVKSEIKKEDSTLEKVGNEEVSKRIKVKKEAVSKPISKVITKPSKIKSEPCQENTEASRVTRSRAIDAPKITKSKSIEIMTPPSTPTKLKKPTLARTLKRTRSQICDLPSPANSFTEEDIVEIDLKQFNASPVKLPLKSLTGSQLNIIKIPKKLKSLQPESAYSRKRIDA